MDVFVLSLHIFLQFLCASGQCVYESPLVGLTTWTGWFSVDEPSDGTDDETLATIRKLYPSVCKSPTRAECRVRFLHGDIVNAGQTLTNSCTPTGLLCQNSDQLNSETCLDYEIRFDCPSPDALPEPNVYWDMSTKNYTDDNEPLTCDGTVRSIYPNIGGLAGTVYLGTLEATDGFDSSDHLCAIRRSEPQSQGYIKFGDAAGKCIAEPQCCTSGFSIAFWMRYPNIPSSGTKYILSTGGQSFFARGVSIHLTKKFTLFVRGDTTRRAWEMKMADASIFPPDAWTHHCFTYDPVQGTKYYKDGALLHSLATHTKIDAPYTQDLDEVVMFSFNDGVAYSKPEGDFSDFKMFYQAFNSTEVQKIYLKETSESNLVIHYLRMHSHEDSFGLELECLAKSGSHPNITWYRSDDGYLFHLISPSSEVAIYDSFPNNYRRRSVLMVRGLSFSTDVIFVCEASDIIRGGAVSKSVTIPKRDMYWTPWLSADEPTDGQDRELLTGHQQAYDLLCDNPTDIQCRTLFTDIPSYESGQIFVNDCTASTGFVCVSADQNSMGNSSCYDYSVRYSCPQYKFRWTSWYDSSHPNGSVEDESLNTHALQNYTDFCSHPIGSECRIKGTNEYLIASGVVPDVPFLCNANGFLCRDANNNKSCPDFEVRYRCPDPSGTNLRINSLRSVGDHFDSTLKLQCKAAMGVHTLVDFSLEWAWFESHQQPLDVKPLAQSELVTISSNTTGTCCKESFLEIKGFYSSLLANKTIVCIGQDGITVDYQTFHVDIASFNGEVTISAESDVIFGDAAVLACHVTGDGVSTLGWYRIPTSNNQTSTDATPVLNETGRYTILKDIKSPTVLYMSLEIESFNEHDNGIYICSVNQNFDSATILLDGEEQNPISAPDDATASYSTVVDDVQSHGTTSSGIDSQHTSTVAKLTPEDLPTTKMKQTYTVTPETLHSTHAATTPQVAEPTVTSQAKTEVPSSPTTQKLMTSDTRDEGLETTVKESVSQLGLTDRSSAAPSETRTFEPFTSNPDVELGKAGQTGTNIAIWLVPVIICTIILVIAVVLISLYVKKKYSSVQPLRPVRSELRELHVGLPGLDFRQSDRSKAEIHLGNIPNFTDGQ